VSVRDVKKAIEIAWRFIVLDVRGPFADFNSFEPISVKLDENSKKWIIKCRFRKGGKLHAAKVEIDSVSGRIVTYELLE